jgi:alkaline phosphatase D
MDRRESIKLMVLAAAGSGHLLEGRDLSAQERAFASKWHEWPDMRWAGPEHWGNRLQDWGVRDGMLECRTRAPDRTLHCLTHRIAGEDFVSRVTLHPSQLGPTAPAARAGFRVGVKGRFADYRSAAVHGTGIDVGVDGMGALFIGDVRSGTTVSLSEPIRLQVQATVVGQRSVLEVTARARDDGSVLARLVREDLASEDLIGSLALLSHFDEPDPSGPAVRFADWSIEGPGVSAHPTATFGPVMFAQYTLHRRTLKLTAQLAPIDLIPEVRAAFEIRATNGTWDAVGSAELDELSRTARFRVAEWDPGRSVEYRVRVTIPRASGPADYEYTGTVAAEPTRDEPLKAAVFSCNADHGFPDGEVVRHVSVHEPDMALFLGDQFYEGSGGFGIQTDSVEEAALDMLHKWYMFGWSYREIFRHVPSAFIPDDHDVYHGNVWGEGGKAAPTEGGWGAPAQDQGGYKMPAAWVNAVQTAQTSHLPDPYDPTPVDQGIGVYYTGWDYGGVSFAILEDRKFKSAPANVLPEDAQVFNGWIQNPDFDVRQYRDLPDASLLGERQMAFLESWAEDWSGPSYMKVVLSQTNFAAVHTIPEQAMSGAVLPGLPMPEPGQYVLGDKLAADMDSNGWPQARRDEALRVIRRCSAFHIAGDQHLATVVRHGIDAFGDAGYSFTGPALNNIWPRRWWPPNAAREAPLDGGPAYAGDFFDGFGNRITVHAAANPRATRLEPSILRDRVTGYGIVTFDKARAQIRIECWPRHVDPSMGDQGQYEGWPLVVSRDSGDGRSPTGFLPLLRIRGVDDPVVEVRTEGGELVYVRRVVDAEFRPPVFGPGTHVVRVGDPDGGRWLERSVSEADRAKRVLDFDF